jgi:hypothetical protein
MSQLPAMGQNPDLTLTLTPSRAYDLPPSKGLERTAF